MIKYGYTLLVLLCWLFVSCSKDNARFTMLVSHDTGIDFSNDLSPSQELNILSYLYYYNGAGVAIGDINNDGLDDIYFTGNQVADRLYQNNGNLRFTDISETSGIASSDGWSTGVTHVDINQDGLLDIYVCRVGSYGPLSGYNVLWLNEGNDDSGTPRFREAAREFGLDIVAFSTQAVFFDYDGDRDLDMFLLCHSVHPNRSYGFGSLRSKIDTLSGDRLYENVNGYFKEVSQQAGINQGKIGYGLGVSVSDINNDGFPDLYVGNDFFENDYLYLNNGDKTFRELNSEDFTALGHTSHYSMGNALTDVNNDGLIDIISLDMLPEDLITLKSSGVEDGFPIYSRFLNNGYSPQFMQNTLHLNRGNGVFSEVGFLSGVAATEWSWGVLSADFDLDGYRDLYISNGIVGATNDMDYIKFIAQDNIQNQIETAKKEVILEFVSKIPSKKLVNYAYKGNGNLTYRDVSREWFNGMPSFSNGCAYGDLDNDGDFDLVVNNVNDRAFVFKNTTIEAEPAHFLSIKLKGYPENTFGVGAKVEIYCQDFKVFETQNPVKSYLSSSSNTILVGLGAHEMVDSIRVFWPNGDFQRVFNIPANETIVVDHKDAGANQLPKASELSYLINIPSMVAFEHKETQTLDFDYDPLIPFALSNEGPALAIGDVNGDSLDDLFIGGAKHQPGKLFLQIKEGHFEESSLVFDPVVNENVAAVFFDSDNDFDLDLVVVSGGNEFETGDPLRPRFYTNENGVFTYSQAALPEVFINASCIKSTDFDGDGLKDLIIGSNMIPRKFGETPITRLLRNTGKNTFEDVTSTIGKPLADLGNVNDIAVVDLDRDGLEDLVLVGDWMPVTLAFNNGKSFDLLKIPESEGLWNSVEIADFDRDGDLDIVAGNWGLNTRLRASSKEPIRLFRQDFDQNGTTETVITYFYKGRETLLASKDELTKQVPSINKKFLSYAEFASAKVMDIFPGLDMNSEKAKRVTTLASSIFMNEGNGKFSIRPLPLDAQISSVNDILVDDFNADGYSDLLLVGNNYEISTQLSRLDASHGVLLINDQRGDFIETISQNFNIAGPARKIEKLKVNGEWCYIVAMNNRSPVFLKKL